MTSFHLSGSELTLDHVSSATLLLEKRRQMLEVQQALDTQKEEYSRKESMFERREYQLGQKDLELQENLCHFNKFLKDKADKRQQYLQKSDEVFGINQSKERDICHKKDELQDIIRHCQSLEKEFKAHEKYEKYLESVKQRSYQEFPEIEYILKRFDLLNEARLSLETCEQNSAQQLESLRILSLEYHKQANIQYLDLNNEKQRLQRTLEAVVNQTNSFELQLRTIVQTNTNRNREFGQLAMCVRNIYSRCEQYFRGIHHFQEFQEQEFSNETTDNDNDIHGIEFEITQKLKIIAHYMSDGQFIANANDTM